MTLKKKSSLFALAPIFFLGLGSCTKDFQGEYANPDQVEIIDDKWNDTDARKTAEFLVNSCLSKPWLATFKRVNSGTRPVVLVDEIENRTEEHIDTKALYESIRDELINSNRISFVNESKRQKLLEEVKYQNSGAVSRRTAKKSGNQTGADYMIGGTITSINSKRGGVSSVNYQTNLVITNLETSLIEWSGKYNIKKRFKQASVGM
jgi:penicillin-binding protein activator